MKMMFLFIMFCSVSAYSVLHLSKRQNKRKKSRKEAPVYACLSRTEKRIQRQQKQLEKDYDNAVDDFYGMLEADAKEEEKVRQLCYKIGKADDEIAHYTKILEYWKADMAELMEKYDSVLARLDAIDNNLSPLDAVEIDEYSGASGAVLYMQRFAEALDDNEKETRKKRAIEAEKLAKLKQSLENKLVQDKNKIFSAKQRIKKAINDKNNAQMMLEAVI